MYKRQPYTARSMTGTGMLLLRGLPLRVFGRQMRHGRKGCGRTDKETRRQQETTQAREARCVCLSVLGCVYASVYPSCSRWLLAKKFGCKRVFAASSSCITQPTASYNVRLNLTDTTLQACCGQTTCCCGSAGRKECRCSLLPNLDALTAPESDEMV